MLAGIISMALALMLLVLLLALWIYAGLYYSVPKTLLKWLSRRAIRVS
jgi:hypothetical protein